MARRPTQLRLRAATAAAVVLVVFFAMTATGAHRRRVPPPQLDFTVHCTGVHGVRAGETCASVARDAGVPLPRFLELNQNVNCGKLFPGQWVCVEGFEVA